MTPPRVLLAVDHRLIRAALRALLERLEDVAIVAEAASAEEALYLIALHRPDVALLDIAKPGMSALEVTARAVRAQPSARVLLLASYTNPDYVSQALSAGAAGYLLKDAEPGELELALDTVARGGTYVSRGVPERIAGAEAASPGAGPASPLDQLTPRQRAVLQLIAEGESTRAIARQLELSVKTVETHRAHLMKRLAIHDVPGLVRYAIRIGLVSPER